MPNALIAQVSCVVGVIAVTQSRRLVASRFTRRRPCVLASRGRLYPSVLTREGLMPEDVFCAMLEVGIESMSELEWAVLDEEGTIAIIPRGVVHRVARRM
jgi:uncharacterized membrane protein YcaP (DUF421 family)